MVFDRINEAARLWTSWQKARQAGKIEEAKRIHERYLKHISTYGTKYGVDEDESFERRLQVIEQRLGIRRGSTHASTCSTKAPRKNS